MKTVPLNDRTWREQMVHLALLREIHLGRVPVVITGTEFEYVGTALKRMHDANYIRTTGDLRFVLGPDAQNDLKKAVAMLDAAEALSVFGTFDPNRPLITQKRLEELRGQGIEGGEVETDDGENVYDYLHDPRFPLKTEPGKHYLDLRIAMMRWTNDHKSSEVGGKVDPRTLVYLQRLIDGKLRRERPELWRDLLLGGSLDDVERTVETAYRWEQSAHNRAAANTIMQQLERAGAVELLKRRGRHCGHPPCAIPLGVYDYNESQAGRELTECPGCKSLFKAPPAPAVEMDEEVVTTTTTTRIIETEEEPLIIAPYYPEVLIVEDYVPLHVAVFDALSTVALVTALMCDDVVFVDNCGCYYDYCY